MAEIRLDDDSIPTYVRRNECIRMLDLAISEAKRRGAEMAEAERDYYMTKSLEMFDLLEAGHANTFIQAVIKGRPKVADKLSDWHAKEVLYKNANEAINAYKLKLRCLEADLEREWEQAGRM
jgi:hypothetical protein